MIPDELPFEYPYRWGNEDLTKMAGVTPEAAALLEQRDRVLEDFLSDLDDGVRSGSNSAQLLVMSATGASIASGGAAVTFDKVIARHGFDGVAAPSGGRWEHPISGVYLLAYEHAWETFQGGGTVRLELDGVLIPEGRILAGASGKSGDGVVAYFAKAGEVGRVHVNHGDASAQTCSATVRIAISDPGGQRDYAAAVLADGPVGYWRLNETSGTTAADSAGTYHMVYTGTYALGAAGVMVDGSGDLALDVSNGGAKGQDWADLEFSGLAAFSVECWFVADTLGTAERILVQKQASSAGNGWEVITDGATGVVIFTRGAGSGTHVSSAAGSIVAGRRYHVVATFDGTVARLYLNGTEVAVDSVDIASMGTNAVALSIGYDSASSGFEFDGRIDEVAVYGRALKATEVDEHYRVGTRN